MANTIRIARSVSTNTPASLDQGEVAYSEDGSPNGEGELFIGTAGAAVTKITTTVTTGTDGVAAQPNASAQDNQVITTGLGIDGADAGDATAITLSLATTELATVAPVTGDALVFDDATDSLPKTQLFSAVPLSIFNDDLGHVENATHTGDVTGDVALTIAADAVTYAKIQNVVADDVFLGNNAGAGAIVDELTGTEATAMLDLFATAATTQGLVPGSNSVGATYFLDGSGTWSIPAGGGDVSGSGATVDNTIVRWSGTGGQTIQESSIVIDDSENVTGMGTLNGKTIADLTSDTDTGSTGWTWVDGTTTLGTSDTVLPTQNAVKVYVDNAVTGALTHKGGYNAATNTPALDTGSPVLVIGDMYTVTVAGTFFTVEVEIGDVLIADVDSVDAAALADWTIVQSNIGAASETVPGYIELATQTEMNTATDDLRAVTPLKYANSTIDGGTF